MRRRVLLAALAAFAAAGCSVLPGDDPEPAPSVTVVGPRAPSSSPSPTASSPAASPEPAVTPTPAQTAQVPTSPFEDRAQVQVARQWAMLVALSINDQETDLGAAGRLMTAHGRDVLPPLFTHEYGRSYPGPVPFTPTKIAVEGDRAAVALCLVSAGFSRAAGTTDTDARRVDAARLTFVRTGGEWQVDELQSRTGSCADVTVEDIVDPSFAGGGTATATPAPSAPAPSPSSSGGRTGAGTD
jgi:hypothetical protein